MIESERHRQGRRVLEEIDPNLLDALTGSLAERSPDLSRLAVEIGFGDVYSREGLDYRSRQLITISALLTLGAQPQLRLHMHAALKVGISPEELTEIVIQIAVYAGFPAALNGMSTLAEVLADAGDDDAQ